MTLKKAIKSVSFLWLGSIIGSGSTFVIYTILARKLEPEVFGIFSSALATIAIFSLLASFGISEVWLKLFGEEGWNGVRWVKPSLRFVFFNLLLISILLFVWAMFGPHDDTTKQLLIVLTLFIYGSVFVKLVVSKLQLEERYSFLAFWQLLPNFLRLILIISFSYFFKPSLNVMDVGFIYAIVGIVFMGLGSIHLYKMYKGVFDLKGHKHVEKQTLNTPKIKNVFDEVWPFGLGGIFAFVYIQSDIIMVKYLSGNSEAGYYNVSFVILTAILIIPTVLYGKYLLPKLHRWANFDRRKFYRVYKKGNLIMLILGGVFMLLVILFSSLFIPLLFGNQYSESIPLTNLLVLILPINFVAYSVGSTLVTKSHMKLKVKLMGFVALTNMILNFFLIPNYGAKGAAVSTIFSNLLLLALYYYVAQNKVFNSAEINKIKS